MVRRLGLRLLVAALALCACGSEDAGEATPQGPFERDLPDETPWPSPKRASADFFAPDDAAVVGSITFQALPPDGVRVDATFIGLDPSSIHGMHLHQAVECDESAAESAHFDGVPRDGEPARMHADPAQIGSHLGDLGNVTADERGSAMVISVVRPLLTIDDGSAFDIVGRVVVLHRGEDDFTSDSDSSGGLLACGKVALVPTE